MLSGFLPRLILLALAAAAAGCAGGGSKEGDLRDAVEGFVQAYGEGDSDAAYGYLSAECQREIDMVEFTSMLALSQVFIGEDNRLVVDDFEVVERSDDAATVDFTVKAEPAGQEVDLGLDDAGPRRLVFEGGGWKLADCEAFGLGM